MRTLDEFIKAISHLPAQQRGITRHVVEADGRVHLFFELGANTGSTDIRDATPWMRDLRAALHRVQPPDEPPNVAVLTEWHDAIHDGRYTYEEAATEINRKIAGMLEGLGEATTAKEINDKLQKPFDALRIWGCTKKQANNTLTDALQNIRDGLPPFDSPPITPKKMQTKFKNAKIAQKSEQNGAETEADYFMAGFNPRGKIA